MVGAADVVLVAGQDGEANVLRVEKARDAERGPPLRYEVRGVETGLMLDDGRTEVAPIVVPAAGDAVEEAVDPEAEEVAEEKRIVAALGELGSATRIDAVVRKAGMKTNTGRDAFDRALAKGRIRSDGPSRKRTYRPVEGGHSPPIPPLGRGALEAPTRSDAPEDGGEEGREGALGAQ